MEKFSGTSEMTGNQMLVFEVEAYLEENFEFRRNVVSGKTEYRAINCEEWTILTEEALNSIVREAKKHGIGDDKSPRQDINEYVMSNAVKRYSPVCDFLDTLPKWDGQNHIAGLFNRIPGMTTETMGWCAVWFRSMVAHWLQMDSQHGNETVPVLIGRQGCGKSTFALRLLPESLRSYYLDHINFGNKFDSEMALTHNLLVNIDEFANMGVSQQGKLKQTLSKQKVNGRPIFGKSQDDRLRYASFIATTNDTHPLCDPTGSRRYICIRIPDGLFIDNVTPLDYGQLYAQALYEIRETEAPYWFNANEVERIQQANAAYFKTDDLETMLSACVRVPSIDEEDGEWMRMNDICDKITKQYPTVMVTTSLKVKIGQTLKVLGCSTKHTNKGQCYRIVPLCA